MDSVNKTLYIPLYGKAYVSRRGLILHDPKAEAIWEAEGFPLKGKAASRWLAYYMGMRSAVFDGWVRQAMEEDPEAIVLHLGCGLDSRAERAGGKHWYDVDFPEVIEERRRYYAESGDYRMIAGDIREKGWLEQLPGNRRAIILMEGVSMYLTAEEMNRAMAQWAGYFASVRLLTDVYSGFAAKMSRWKNPINEVGVTEVHGWDDPQAPAAGTGLTFVKEHDMTPEAMIAGLPRQERGIFRRLYAGKFARGLYRLWEYRG